MAKKYSEAIILRRLVNIQKLHEDIKKKNDTSKYNTIDKITYLLWSEPDTRNSDIWLSIRLYKLFYPDYIDNDTIKLDYFFKLPKMYDIQRTRAEVQNTEGLFPAKDEVRQKRVKRESEFYSYYKDKKKKTLRTLPDYCLYLDESGKTDKYFVLAGVLLNGDSDNNSQTLRFNSLKKTLNDKHHLSIKEFKFTEINSRNLAFYKDMVDTVFKEGLPLTFISIIVENKGLKRSTEKNKTKDLLQILLKDNLASIIVRATCSSPYASNKAKINITLDKDGCGYDSIEKEMLRQNLDTQLKQQYRYLVELDSLEDTDSKDNVLVQLADLYASSINNVFSEVKAESETAKSKKEFAKYLLNHVGLDKITREYANSKSNVKYLNKVITAGK